MERAELKAGRVAASLTILAISAITLYAACLRSSTIYFYELDTTTVVFMSMPLAVLFPLVLSLALFVTYLSKKPKEMACQTSPPSPEKKSTRRFSIMASHKGSDLRQIIEEKEPMKEEATPLKQKAETEKEETKEEKSVRKDSSTMTTTEDGNNDTPEFSLGQSAPTSPEPESDEATTPPTARRTSSTSRIQRELLHRPRKDSLLARGTSQSALIKSEPRKELCEIFKEIEQGSIWMYALGGFDAKIFPGDRHTQFKPKHTLLNLIIEILATHVPIWLCVGALYLLSLEFLRMNFAYYFYFHEDVMEFCALFCALGVGAVHEYRAHWITNDILALCSIYVVVSRLQPVSFISASALLGGFFVFDLFWLYIVDLLSTVVSESKAPIMLVVPRDNKGNKQYLATLDVIVPGIFLNLVLKYSSMYDKKLFFIELGGLYVSLLITTFVAIWKRRTTPAMVLPAVVLISTSLFCTTTPDKLWKFMIKH